METNTLLFKCELKLTDDVLTISSSPLTTDSQQSRFDLIAQTQDTIYGFDWRDYKSLMFKRLLKAKVRETDCNEVAVTAKDKTRRSYLNSNLRWIAFRRHLLFKQSNMFDLAQIMLATGADAALKSLFGDQMVILTYKEKDMPQDNVPLLVVCKISTFFNALMSMEDARKHLISYEEMSKFNVNLIEIMRRVQANVADLHSSVIPNMIYVDALYHRYNGVIMNLIRSEMLRDITNGKLAMASQKLDALANGVDKLFSNFKIFL